MTAASPPAPRVLVVTADVERGHLYAARVRRHARATVLTTAARAATTRLFDCVGAVADPVLPDGCGLALLARLRARDPALPLLLVSPPFRRELVNATTRLRAGVVYGDAIEDGIEAFVARALARGASASARIDVAAHEIADAARCSPAETELARQVGRGVARADLGARLDIAAGVLDRRVHAVLQKTGASRLSELRLRIVERATKVALG